MPEPRGDHPKSFWRLPVALLLLCYVAVLISISLACERGAGAIQFYSEGARNTNMTLMYELLGSKARVSLRLGGQYRLRS